MGDDRGSFWQGGGGMITAALIGLMGIVLTIVITGRKVERAEDVKSSLTTEIRELEERLRAKDNELAQLRSHPCPTLAPSPCPASVVTTTPMPAQESPAILQTRVQQKPASVRVFQNRFLKMSVRSLEQEQGGHQIRMAVVVDNIMTEDFGLYCKLRLSDQTGHEWTESDAGSSGVGRFEMFPTTHTPGVPAIGTLMFHGQQPLALDSNLLDLAGECGVTIRGRPSTFQLALTGLAVGN